MSGGMNKNVPRMILWSMLLSVSLIVALSTAAGHSVGDEFAKQAQIIHPRLDLQSREGGRSLTEAQLDSFITSIMEDDHIPGVSACVVKDGQLVWTGAYGWANIEVHRAVTDSTLFMLASESKPFTAVALMQLWEDGFFQLDDDINDYLPFEVIHPFFPDSTITLRMLMTHTSSIDDHWPTLNDLIFWGGDSPIPLGQFLEDYLVPGGQYYDDSANWLDYTPPGECFHYSNVNFGLVGYLMAEIAGSTFRQDADSIFEQQCQDSLFLPLGMEETSWFLTNLDTTNIAMPYYWDGNTYVPYGHYGFPFYPAGQLRTSSLQFARFVLAILQGGLLDGVRILDSATIDTMMTVQVPDAEPGWDVCLPWWRAFIPELDDHIWTHWGSWMGCTAIAEFCPSGDENWGYVVLTNGTEPSGLPLTTQIGEQLRYFAHDYVCPMVMNIQLLSPSTARLSWNPVTGATQYNLYRSTAAYLFPSTLPWQTVTVPTTYFDFTDGIGDENTNYYFVGRAENEVNISSNSNTVGEHDFGVDIP